jgi:hypothetical protein
MLTGMLVSVLGMAFKLSRGLGNFCNNILVFVTDNLGITNISKTILVSLFEVVHQKA